MKKFVSFLSELNLPNKLTLLRMALVPVYLVLLSQGLDGVALVVFAAASITDALDGKIARKYNLITDKLLTHTAFIMLCAMGRLHVAACIIFIAREFVVSGLRLVAVEQGHVIAAGMSGKIKTVLQMLLAMLLTIMQTSLLSDLLAFAAAAVTLYSMAEYIWQNRAVLGGAK